MNIDKSGGIMDVLKRFFAKIGLEVTEEFNMVTVEKVIVNKKNETWDIHLKSPNVLPINSVLNLLEVCKKEHEDVHKINIKDRKSVV